MVAEAFKALLAGAGAGLEREAAAGGGLLAQLLGAVGTRRQRGAVRRRVEGHATLPGSISERSGCGPSSRICDLRRASASRIFSLRSARSASACQAASDRRQRSRTWSSVAA